jgi:nucleoside 2-deoxyribosyltransferase
MVYVSGPLTTGCQTDNIRAAVKAGVELMAEGYVVIVPHEKAGLTEVLYPQSYEAWLAYDFKCILRCDAVLRLPGSSKGADAEVGFAHNHGIPVYYSIKSLMHHVHPAIGAVA